MLVKLHRSSFSLKSRSGRAFARREMGPAGLGRVVEGSGGSTISMTRGFCLSTTELMFNPIGYAVRDRRRAPYRVAANRVCLCRTVRLPKYSSNRTIRAINHRRAGAGVVRKDQSGVVL